MPRRPAARRRRTAPVAVADPDVILDVVFEDGLFYLALRNIGARPARDVTVSFDEPIVGLAGREEVSALALFRGVPFLAPGREIRTLLDASAAYFARGAPERITARVSYRDARGRRRAAAIDHDLGIYRTVAYARGRAGLREGG
jgi:hypothetical protein